MTNINNRSKVLSIKNSSKQKEGKKNRKGASQMIFSVYFYKTVITLTRGKFPPFCLLAGSCCTRSNIRYRENTATQKIAPPHTVTCFLSFILLQNLLSNLKKKWPWRSDSQILEKDDKMKKAPTLEWTYLHSCCASSHTVEHSTVLSSY